MDNVSLSEIINKIPLLKYKYLGSYPANNSPILPVNSFKIVNTEPGGSEGGHWILLANRDGKLFYGDSLGQPIEMYTHISPQVKIIHDLVTHKLQIMPSLCGLYCIYFAWRVYNRLLPILSTNDLDVLQFIYKYI